LARPPSSHRAHPFFENESGAGPFRLNVALRSHIGSVLFFSSRGFSARLIGPRQFQPSLMSVHGKRVTRPNRRNQKEFIRSSCAYKTGKTDRLRPARWRGIALTTFGRKTVDLPEPNTQNCAGGGRLDSQWGTTPAEKPNPPKPEMSHRLLTITTTIATGRHFCYGEGHFIKGNFNGEGGNRLPRFRHTDISGIPGHPALNPFTNYYGHTV